MHHAQNLVLVHLGLDPTEAWFRWPAGRCT
jgi:hypothetical protein